MGYDLLWFVCKVASCDPATVSQVIEFEQHEASLKILEQAGVEIQGMPTLKLSPPPQSSEDLLQQINVEELRKEIAAAVPTGWTLTHDSNRETQLQSDGGAVQISWGKRYVIGTGYGKFEGGLEALHNALAAHGFICFDPQFNKAFP